MTDTVKEKRRRLRVKLGALYNLGPQGVILGRFRHFPMKKSVFYTSQCFLTLGVRR